jgi:hypothetical protein
MHLDITSIVSLKFTFAVTLTEGSYYVPDSFHINSVIKAHDCQKSVPQIDYPLPETPYTSMRQDSPSAFQDSPASAMQRLSTITPTMVHPYCTNFIPNSIGYRYKFYYINLNNNNNNQPSILVSSKLV